MKQKSIKLNKLKSDDWVIQEEVNDRDDDSSLGSLEAAVIKVGRLDTFADES